MHLYAGYFIKHFMMLGTHFYTVKPGACMLDCLPSGLRKPVTTVVLVVLYEGDQSNSLMTTASAWTLQMCEKNRANAIVEQDRHAGKAALNAITVFGIQQTGGMITET